jgi:drug/metabolite transporter (DMT)-like permease
MTEENKVVTIYLPLITVQLAFSFLPSFSKMAFASFPYLFIALCRVLGGSLVFYLIYRLTRYEKIQKKSHYLLFAIYGLFGIALNQMLFLMGLTYSTAINASILMMSVPIFTVILAIILRQERPSLLRITGIALAAFGAVLLVGVDRFTMSNTAVGNILFLVNAFCFAVYLVISKPILKIYRSFTMITWVFVFGCLEVIPFTLVAASKVVKDSPPISAYLPILGIVVVGTLIPYFLNAVALKRAKPSQVAVFINLQPIFGTIFAILLIGETFRLKTAIAGVLVILGVALVNIESPSRPIKYIQQKTDTDEL